MTPTRGLTDGSQTPGVYRVLAPPATIAAELRSAGWSVGDLLPTASVREFYARIAAGLGFPDYFGHNLDALWDCLGDLPGPTAVVLREWTRLATLDPDGWQPIYRLLRERSTSAPAFAVVLA